MSVSECGARLIVIVLLFFFFFNFQMLRGVLGFCVVAQDTGGRDNEVRSEALERGCFFAALFPGVFEFFYLFLNFFFSFLQVRSGLWG